MEILQVDTVPLLWSGRYSEHIHPVGIENLKDGIQLISFRDYAPF